MMSQSKSEKKEYDQGERCGADEYKHERGYKGDCWMDELHIWHQLSHDGIEAKVEINVQIIL